MDDPYQFQDYKLFKVPAGHSFYDPSEDISSQMTVIDDLLGNNGMPEPKADAMRHLSHIAKTVALEYALETMHSLAEGDAKKNIFKAMLPRYDEPMDTKKLERLFETTRDLQEDYDNIFLVGRDTAELADILEGSKDSKDLYSDISLHDDKDPYEIAILSPEGVLSIRYIEAGMDKKQAVGLEIKTTSADQHVQEGLSMALDSYDPKKPKTSIFSRLGPNAFMDDIAEERSYERIHPHSDEITTIEKANEKMTPGDKQLFTLITKMRAAAQRQSLMNLKDAI